MKNIASEAFEVLMAVIFVLIALLLFLFVFVPLCILSLLYVTPKESRVAAFLEQRSYKWVPFESIQAGTNVTEWLLEEILNSFISNGSVACREPPEDEVLLPQLRECEFRWIRRGGRIKRRSRMQWRHTEPVFVYG